MHTESYGGLRTEARHCDECGIASSFNPLFLLTIEIRRKPANPRRSRGTSTKWCKGYSIPLDAEREMVERIEHEAETASKPGGDGGALCARGLTRCRGLPGQGVGWRGIRRETKGVRR